MKTSFYTIFCTLNRKAELERLVAWARRKRLPGPENLYQCILIDIESKLMLYTIREPRKAKWARRAHQLATLINPGPRYYPSRAAAVYKHRHG